MWKCISTFLNFPSWDTQTTEHDSSQRVCRGTLDAHQRYSGQPRTVYTRTNFDTCRSRWLRGLGRGFAAARLLGLRVRIPSETWMYVSCECSDGLITRPEKSYWMCVSLSVFRCKNNSLHLKWVGRKFQTKNEKRILIRASTSQKLVY
jgi:hypothetical protein